MQLSDALVDNMNFTRDGRNLLTTMWNEKILIWKVKEKSDHIFSPYHSMRENPRLNQKNRRFGGFEAGRVGHLSESTLMSA